MRNPLPRRHTIILCAWTIVIGIGVPLVYYWSRSGWSEQHLRMMDEGQPTPFHMVIVHWSVGAVAIAASAWWAVRKARNGPGGTHPGPDKSATK